jgi:hypothetical protein
MLFLVNIALFLVVVGYTHFIEKGSKKCFKYKLLITIKFIKGFFL